MLSVGAIILLSWFLFSAVAPYFLLPGVSFGLSTDREKKERKKNNLEKKK